MPQSRGSRRNFNGRQDHGSSAAHDGHLYRDEGYATIGYRARRRAEDAIAEGAVFDSTETTRIGGLLGDLRYLGRTARRRNIQRHPRSISHLPPLDLPKRTYGPI